MAPTRSCSARTAPHFGMDWTQKAIAESRISDADKEAIPGGNAAAAIARVAGRMAVAAQ